MECWELAAGAELAPAPGPELACAFATPREHSELKWKPRRCLQIKPDHPRELRTLSGSEVAQYALPTGRVLLLNRNLTYVIVHVDIV